MIPLDCEASSADPRTAKLRLVGIGQHAYAPKDLPLLDNVSLLMHNAGYDLTLLLRQDKVFHSLDNVNVDDTKIVARVAQLPDTSMKGLASRILGRPVPDYVQQFGDPAGIELVPWDVLATYCLEDCVMTAMLWERFRTEVPSWAWRVYYEIERPIIPVVAEMNLQSFCVSPKLVGFARVLRDKTAFRERMFRDLTLPECPNCGGSGRNKGFSQSPCRKCSPTKDTCDRCEGTGYRPFNRKCKLCVSGQINPHSSDQAALALRAVGLRLREKTPTGKDKLDDAILAALWRRTGHPAVRALREMREYKKLMGTYVDKYLKMGRVGSLWGQSAAKTGRFTSHSENLQNVPPVLKPYLEAPPGMTILSCDASQIEFRVSAHLSQDPHMLEAYRNGEDMHSLTQARLGLSTRKMAKIVNFGGGLYGGTAKTLHEAALKQDENLPISVAQSILIRMRQEFPRYYQYSREVSEQGLATGWVDGLFGRRLKIDPWAREDEQRRQAVNFPSQGSAADIIKKAMYRVRKLGYPIMAQVHDEIVVCVRDEDVLEYSHAFKEAFEAEQPLDVPMTVEMKVGKTWG